MIVDKMFDPPISQEYMSTDTTESETAFESESIPIQNIEDYNDVFWNPQLHGMEDDQKN